MSVLTTDIDGVLGCGKPDILLNARQYLERRFGVALNARFLGSVEPGEFYDCAQTPFIEGRASDMLVQVGRIVLVYQCI